MSALYEVGYAPGVYDLFHVGHLNLLRQARKHCKTLIAGVVSDSIVENRKGITPVVPEQERLDIVSALGLVDVVVLEDLPTKTQMWERVRFDSIFKGDDWQGTPQGDQLEASFEPLGVSVVYLPYTLHTSSTRLRRALDALEANHRNDPVQVSL